MAAVVLAAGRGARLGGRAKSLLELDGEPLIRRTVSALRAGGVGDVVVVTGHHAPAIEAALTGLAVRLVRNPDPDAGPVSSQRLGLRAVASTDATTMMVLADQPLLGPTEVADLIGAWRQRPAGVEVVVPHTDGVRGNPVMVGATARAEILVGPPDLGCRQWQARWPARVWAWATQHLAYGFDVDTPDDLASFTRLTGRVLHDPPAHTS